MKDLRIGFIMLIQMILIQVITFAAIVFVLRKLLYTESLKETERLKDLKTQTIEKQRELDEKVKAAESVYRDKSSQAEDDVRRLRAKTAAEIEEARKKIIDSAKANADELVKTALNTKEKIREEIILAMNKRLPALAFQLFKETSSDAVRKMTHKELVNAAVGALKNIDKGQLKAKVERVELLSAYPLEASERKEISAALSANAIRGAKIKEKEDKDMFAGLIVKLGSLVVDGSLNNRLRQVKDKLNIGL